MSEAFKATYDNGNPNMMEKYFSQIQIYFSSLEYPDVTMESSYEFMSLMSDVGGALGLVLGATLITIFEIIEFSYQLALDMLSVETHETGGGNARMKHSEGTLQNRPSWKSGGSAVSVKQIFVNEVGVDQGTDNKESHS